MLMLPMQKIGDNSIYIAQAFDKGDIAWGFDTEDKILQCISISIGMARRCLQPI